MKRPVFERTLYRERKRASAVSCQQAGAIEVKTTGSQCQNAETASTEQQWGRRLHLEEQWGQKQSCHKHRDAWSLPPLFNCISYTWGGEGRRAASVRWNHCSGCFLPWFWSHVQWIRGQPRCNLITLLSTCITQKEEKTVVKINSKNNSART